MERVPTQTDLLRLCDAADDIVNYYRRQILQGHGTVQGFTWQVDLFANIVRLLPHPQHYWTPFEIDFWESIQRWQGWTDAVYDTFVGVIFHARNIHQNWLKVCADSKPTDRVQARSNFVEEQVRLLKQCTEVLRSLCQFVPCEEQQDILAALDGVCRTADELQHECNISRSRLYGKRNDKDHGGLNELMRVGLVANGTKDNTGIGGYYRPDRPPK